MSLKFATIPPKRLTAGITSASTEFFLNNILSFDGVTDVLPTDLGTQHYCCFRNDTGTRIELMEIDPATISSGPITIVRRGLSFYGDLTTQTTDLKLDWPANETMVQLGTDVPQIFEYIIEYVNSAIIAGGTPASTTNPGIVLEATQAETDAGTATRNVSAVTYDLMVRADKNRARNINGYYADAGSTDAYVITPSPAITAYAAGQVFIFKANTINAGAATLNVNGIGAKTIKKNLNIDLSDGDIKANQIIIVIYDGTNFQLLSRTNTSAATIKTYSAGATWTKPAGLSYIIVETIGGGGGGGKGASSPPASAGGGGGYARTSVAASSLGSTETVTIGTGGLGKITTSGTGATGGTTSFGAFCSATGGVGGQGNSASPSLGGAGTGDFTLNGFPSNGANAGTGGDGGDGPYGLGKGGTQTSGSATAGAGKGAGGAGGSATTDGLNGSDGFCIVTEFY